MAENPPNATLYVRNLDEKAKLPVLIDALREIFSEFGEILDIVAKKNIKARGQAFVVFSSADEAQDALDTLQGFDLLERPMTIAFAKSRSDAIVQREDGEEGLEVHKQQRLAEKERKKQEAAAKEAANPAKRPAAENLAERPAKTTKPGHGQIADDYLPPNKTLLLRDLPEDFGKPELTAAFSQYPGFKEIRTVPGRKGLAFAEYDDEQSAVPVKEAMNGSTLGDKTIRVTYQRQ